MCIIISFWNRCFARFRLKQVSMAVDKRRMSKQYCVVDTWVFSTHSWLLGLIWLRNQWWLIMCGFSGCRTFYIGDKWTYQLWSLFMVFVRKIRAAPGGNMWELQLLVQINYWYIINRSNCSWKFECSLAITWSPRKKIRHENQSEKFFSVFIRFIDWLGLLRISCWPLNGAFHSSKQAHRV